MLWDELFAIRLSSKCAVSAYIHSQDTEPCCSISSSSLSCQHSACIKLFLGLMISALWIGNAFGAITGAALVRSWRIAGIAGLSLLAFSFSGYYASKSIYLLSFFIFAGGFGSGILQPLLAPSMHISSNPEYPFRGVSLYSTALSLALVAGP